MQARGRVKMYLFASGMLLSLTAWGGGEQETLGSGDVVADLRKLGAKVTTDDAGDAVELRISRGVDIRAALEHIPALHRVSALWLQVPGIDDADLQTIAPLVQLKRLQLGSGKSGETLVTDEGMKSLAALRGLSRLTLIRSRISDTGLAHLKGIHGLQYLNLSANSIHDGGVAHLGGLTNLQELDLSSTWITDEGLVHLRNLIHLETLRIAHTRVTGKGLTHVKGLKKLRSLDLTDSDVDDDSLDAVKDLSQLESLSLCGTKVSDTGLSKLHTLIKVRTVWLFRSRTTSKGRADLQKALPKAIIIGGWGSKRGRG